jgi:hypothetical protein
MVPRDGHTRVQKVDLLEQDFLLQHHLSIDTPFLLEPASPGADRGRPLQPTCTGGHPKCTAVFNNVKDLLKRPAARPPHLRTVLGRLTALEE